MSERQDLRISVSQPCGIYARTSLRRPGLDTQGAWTALGAAMGNVGLQCCVGLGGHLGIEKPGRQESLVHSGNCLMFNTIKRALSCV